MMMMAEKIRHILLKIIGFATGIIATILVLYLFEVIGLLIFIAGCITFAISRRFKRLTNEIEYLKKEIDKLKRKE